MSKLWDRIHLFRNGVDSERRQTNIHIREQNVGASEINAATLKSAEPSDEAWSVGSELTNVVLLYDVFEEVLRIAKREGVPTNPLHILMKMDIEVRTPCCFSKHFFILTSF